MRSELSPGAFRKAVAARSFAPVYLLHGEEDFLKEGAVRLLMEAVVEPSVRDFNLEVRRGAELDAETLEALLGTPPMMADRRLVVIRDVGALRKNARRALDRYLERPAPDAVVALVALAEGKEDRELRGHASVTPVHCRQLDGDQVTSWIAHHVKGELGGSITAEAASLLHAAVGADLAALAAELDKLLSYTGGAEIDEGAVGAIVGVRRGETLGDFLDAVAERDAGRALDLMRHVLQQPKSTGVSIVMAMAMQATALAYAQAAHAEGMPRGRLEKDLFDLLKEGGGFAGRPWGEAVRSWVGSYRRWTVSELDAALESLLEADIALKESTVSNEEQILTDLVLALCARRGV